MRSGNLTAHEAEIIHQLLAKRHINQYEIVGAEGEGRALPGSTSPGDLEWLSGRVVTSTTAYSFWLDWVDGGYTLGEHDGSWRELGAEEMKHYEIAEAQARLRQKG